MSESEKIDALLTAVEESGATFIRNGAEHDARAAREHLAMKRDRAGKHVKTAEEFIDRLASRSSLSGEPYRMRLADGREVETGAWLRERLAEIEGERR